MSNAVANSQGYMTSSWATCRSRSPWQHADCQSAWHLYVIRLDLAGAKRTHLEVFEELRERGIGVNLHYIPVHTQPFYRRLGFSIHECPEAERYYSEALSLPLFPTLSDALQARVVEALAEATRVAL